MTSLRRGRCARSVREQLPSRASLLATLLLWLPLLLWFAAFRPGIMSADSLAVWGQANGARWVDVQPPLYTAAMWASDRIVGSPSLLTLGQTLLLASALAAMAMSVVRAGANTALCWTLAGALVVSPMVGAFSVSLWKDIPYVAALLFIGARLVDVTVALIYDGRPAVDRALRRLVGWSVLAVLLRQNGIVLVAVLFAALLVALRGSRRIVLVGGLGILGVLAGAKLVVYPALDVAPAPEHSPIAIQLHDIAAVTAEAPQVLEAHDRELLGRVAPLEDWAAQYRLYGCDSANWQFESAFDWNGAVGYRSEFVSLWFEVLTDASGVVARNRLCVTAIAWHPGVRGDMYTVSRGIDPNDQGLTTIPVISGLNDIAIDVIDLSERHASWFLWRGVVWVYLAYAALVVTVVRTRLCAYGLPIVMLIALQLSVMPFNPAQDARYMTGGLVLGGLLIPLATVDRARVGGRQAATLTEEASALGDELDEGDVEARKDALPVLR